MSPTQAKKTQPKLYVIHVSTRPGRAGFPLSTWIFERAASHGAFEVELVDLRAENLPMFDEPRHPRLRQYEHEHTKRWAAKVRAWTAGREPASPRTVSHAPRAPDGRDVYVYFDNTDIKLRAPVDAAGFAARVSNVALLPIGSRAAGSFRIRRQPGPMTLTPPA